MDCIYTCSTVRLPVNGTLHQQSWRRPCRYSRESWKPFFYQLHNVRAIQLRAVQTARYKCAHYYYLKFLRPSTKPVGTKTLKFRKWNNGLQRASWLWTCFEMRPHSPSVVIYYYLSVWDLVGPNPSRKLNHVFLFHSAIKIWYKSICSFSVILHPSERTNASERASDRVISSLVKVKLLSHTSQLLWLPSVHLSTISNNTCHGLTEWVSELQRPRRHIIGHFTDESCQSITCNDTVSHR